MAKFRRKRRGKPSPSPWLRAARLSVFIGTACLVTALASMGVLRTLRGAPKIGSSAVGDALLLNSTDSVTVICDRDLSKDNGLAAAAAAAVAHGLGAVHLLLRSDQAPAWEHGDVSSAEPEAAKLPFPVMLVQEHTSLSPASIIFALAAATLVRDRRDIVGVCLHVLKAGDASDGDLLLASRRCEGSMLLTSLAGELLAGKALGNGSALLSVMEERNLMMAFPRRSYEDSDSSRLESVLEVPTKATFEPREAQGGDTFEESNRKGLEDLLAFTRSSATGQILLSVINKHFVKFARSFLCNLQSMGFRPGDIAWVVTDQEAFEQMSHVPGVRLFHLHGMTGAQGTERGTTFGTPGYWELMLSRARLVNQLLQRGVSLLLFDADQVWLRDPMPYLPTSDDFNVDVSGTVVSGDEVGGNFVYLRATNRTRVMYSALVKMFEEDYLKWEMDKHDGTFTRTIRNDQTILGSFVHRNEKWKATFQCNFAVLDRDLFVDGRWYKGVYKSNPRTHQPVIVNNNYVEGIDPKVERALKFGHWFLGEDGQTCVRPEVISGLS